MSGSKTMSSEYFRQLQESMRKMMDRRIFRIPSGKIPIQLE